MSICLPVACASPTPRPTLACDRSICFRRFARSFRSTRPKRGSVDPKTSCSRPRAGARHDRNNARRRVVVKSVERANENLAATGRNPLPEGITPHSLRRTFISLLLATGAEVPYVMRQVGHTDPKVTLSIYAQVMYRGEGERERLKIVSEGSDWALLGTGDDFAVPEPGEQLTLEAAESQSGAGDSADGRGWVRTSDLSRVRRALSH